MLNFDYSIPTKVFFGRDRIKVLAAQLSAYGDKVLIVYGGGSIKRIGLYDTVTDILDKSGIAFWELGGVNPNPRVDSVRQGAEICRKNGINAILAIGGGSSIDCAKAIGAAALYDGDAWDIVENPKLIKDVLPIACILTIAATGSEMDRFAVISNLATNQKISTQHELMKPRFAILDPTYTFSVPKSQTAAGTADIMSHIFENYFCNTTGAYLQDRLAEAMLKTCIEFGVKAVNEPENYDARANLMWTSSLAINDILCYGKERKWSVHPMEHVLSAYYDITHGVGLAILTPNWMKHVLDDRTVEYFAAYAVNVWSMDSSKDKYALAEAAIDKTRDYFISLGLPTKLREVGVEKDKLELLADKVTNGGSVGGFKPLYKDDVLEIFNFSF